MLIININIYKKLKLFWTKSFHPYVNDSLIINCQFIFWEDKILFTRSKTLVKLNISFQCHLIKQYNCLEYLVCFLDYNLNGETMVWKVLNKINGKLKLLYRQATFLNPTCRRLLCNALKAFVTTTEKPCQTVTMTATT